MELKDAYNQKMAAQLKEWGAQINLIEAKVENAGADMKLKRAGELDKLRAKQRAATKKMKELETAVGKAWDRVRETADKVWEDIKTGVAEAHSGFN